MTHARPITPTFVGFIRDRLAPKLIAFLATGLTASGLIYIVGVFGFELPAGPAAFLVTAISGLAAYFVRDNLLALPWNQLAPKVVVFLLTGVSATTVLTVAGFFGIDLSLYTPIITAFVTLLGTFLAYIKKDEVPVEGIVEYLPGSASSIE